MMGIGNLFKKSYPILDWIQVEISSYCNCECIYCPHTEYRHNWQSGHLSVELFKKLETDFTKTKLVFLQGWGEPFSCPYFFDLLSSAKKAGCMVGTTTNGALLNTEKIKRLVDGDLDIIAFSLAGIDKKNDLIRKGTSIKKVFDFIEKIHRVKESYGTENPRIHIAYMLLRSGIGDLERLPSLLANAGVSQTVISSLSLAVNSNMEHESNLASSKIEFIELKNKLYEIRRTASKKGSQIYYNIVSPFKNILCSENINHAVVMGFDGSIGPCVMNLIPVKGKNNYYLKGIPRKLERLSFGNISEEPLNIIWHKNEYKNFINSFIAGRPPLFCQNCSKMFIDTLNKDVILQ